MCEIVTFRGGKMDREIQDYMHQEVYKRCHSVLEKMQVVWRERKQLDCR